MLGSKVTDPGHGGVEYAGNSSLKVVTYIELSVSSCTEMVPGNILYVEDKCGWHVLPIDFEYCSYNYRSEFSYL